MATRTPDEEKNHVKNYKNVEKLLGKHDLNPAIDSPSPGDIDDNPRAKNYHQANKNDIIGKLEKAIDHAEKARQLFLKRTSGTADANNGHQLRIKLYKALVADQHRWYRDPRASPAATGWIWTTHCTLRNLLNINAGT